MPSQDGSINALWVAIAIIVAIMIGATAGFLSWHGGQPPPNAILTGGAAFSGAVLLMFVIRNELALNSQVLGRSVRACQERPHYDV
jgi:hypothetical protein